jgi:hypothetical protein
MAPTLTITAGVGARGDKEVVQRTHLVSGAGGAQGLGVSGTLGDISDTQGIVIEVRVVEDPHGAEVVPWTPLSNQQAHLTSGQWSGELITGAALANGVPSGSWYNWEFRATDRNGTVLVSNVAETARWGVGSVIPWWGQSNQVFGMLRADSSAATPDANIGFFSPSGEWVDLTVLDAYDITGGYVAGAVWRQATGYLELTGAFTNYTHSGGNKIYLWGGGITPGLYEINAKIDNDNLEIVESLGAADVSGIVSQPQANGVVDFLNAVQTAAGVATGVSAYPVAVVYAAVAGTSLIQEADAIAAGAWTDFENGPYAAAKALMLLATSRLTCEAICYQQGESDGIAPGVNLYIMPRNAYYESLVHLHRKIEIDYVGGPNAVPEFIMATVGPHAAPATTFANNMAVFAQILSVQEEQIRWAIDNDKGLAYLQTVDLDTSTVVPLDRGLHWTILGYEESGAAQAEAVNAKLGFDAGASAVGPQITAAYFGDEETPDLGALNKITLYVQHDKGTDLTLGNADSINCFEVYDQAGPLAVTAIAKGTTVGGVQKLVLTLSRDTGQTDSADIPYSAPDLLTGNVAFVRYIGLCSIPHGSSPQNNLIVDNATPAMPLLLTFGGNVEHRSRLQNDPLWELNYWAGNNIVALVTDVTNLATRRIVVGAPNTWTVNNPDGLGSLQIRPGDRVLFYFLDSVPAPPQPYVYRTEAVVEKVQIYTDQTTAVDVLTTHSLNGHPAANKPIVGDAAVFRNREQTQGALVAVARSAQGTGK